MNDIQDVVALKPTQASPRVDGSGSAAAARGATAPVADPPKDDVAPPRAPVVLRMRPSLFMVPLLMGGLSGAVLGLAAFFVITALSPPQDPRVPPIARQVELADQRADVHDRTLRTARGDLARLSEASTGLERRIDQQDARTRGAFDEIEATRRELRAVVGTRSPMFGIAVAQLGAAVVAGRPFETEWANLHALTADDPALRALITPLKASAATGIETPARLRASLARVAREGDVPNGARQGVLSRGVMGLQSLLALPLVFSAAEIEASALLAAADRQLAIGDVPGTVAILAYLPAPFGARMAPWMDAARRHETAHAAVLALGGIARERLLTAARAPARP
ncbi:MAG: hypothetical protein IT561_20040 [Alphaproteobacteria bacterium]|nr:hypothetical protein [Alphaproteobacteria bacterium]